MIPFTMIMGLFDLGSSNRLIYDTSTLECFILVCTEEYSPVYLCSRHHPATGLSFLETPTRCSVPKTDANRLPIHRVLISLNIPPLLLLCGDDNATAIIFIDTPFCNIDSSHLYISMKNCYRIFCAEKFPIKGNAFDIARMWKLMGYRKNRNN